MKIFCALKDMFWGRMPTSFYRENRTELRTTNFKLLRKACLFTFGMCAFLFCLSQMNPLVAALRWFYLSYMVFFGALSIIIFVFVAKRLEFVAPCFYLFAAAIFSMVIQIGTSRSPHMLTVTFHVFLLVIPILLVTRPIYAVFLSVIACSIFCVATGLAKGWDTPLAQTDMLNAICCCIAGAALSSAILNVQLENIQNQAELKRLSGTDELTGLPNRRSFDAYLSALSLTQIQADKTLAVMMIDIDNFKSFNDTYGHLEGDVCLQKVSASLRQTAEQHNAFLARFGGEEFVCVGRWQNTISAAHVAETFVRQIAALQIPHQESLVGTITISVGYAEHQTAQHADVAHLLQCADTALYRAKASGKNTAAAWNEEAHV